LYLSLTPAAICGSSDRTLRNSIISIALTSSIATSGGIPADRSFSKRIIF